MQLVVMQLGRLLRKPWKVQSNAKMTTPVRSSNVRGPFRKSTGNSGVQNAI